MKKIIFTLFCIIGLLYSCDDILDKEPISAKEYDGNVKIKNASEAESYLVSCYSALRGEYFMLDLFVNNEMQSDNSYDGDGGSDYIEIDHFKLSISNSQVKRVWADLFSYIGTANTIVDEVSKLSDTLFSGNRRKQIIAEAKAIRAYCYFDLVRTYGGVPLVNYETPAIRNSKLDSILPLIYPKRASDTAIYGQIKRDMKEASVDLTSSTTNKGIMTKAAAYATLAKVYATFPSVSSGKIHWDSVQYYCKKITEDNNFGLLDKYDDLFAIGRTENTKEEIFIVPCVLTDGYDSWYNCFIGSDWKKYDVPTNDLISAFDTEGDSIRKKASISYIDARGKFSDIHWPDNTNFPQCYKIRSGPNDVILLRLADIMLLQAESENQLGNISNADTLLNKVRKRAKLNPKYPTTKEEMTLALEKERRLELAFEGNRWFDLKRTGRLKEVMDNFKFNGTKVYDGLVKTDKTNWIWPIPQSQIDLNSKLTQNPGY